MGSQYHIVAECAYIVEPCPSIDPRSISTEQDHEGVNSVMTLYPNPAHQQLHIDFKRGRDEDMYIDILSPTGILQKRVPKPREATFLKVDISELNSGLYIITLHSTSELLTSTKFIKI